MPRYPDLDHVELGLTREGQAWAVIWKENKRARFRDMILSFGVSKTAELALAKVEQALRFGTVNPPRTPQEFKREFANGVFMPVPTHIGIRLERWAGR